MHGFMASAFGEASWVWHEVVSTCVHVDVHVVAPTPARPLWVVYTTGMSGREMAIPQAARDAKMTPYAELVIGLPANWPLSNSKRFALLDEADHATHWPIKVVKYFARFPHDYATWLGVGHTVPNGDPPVPFADGMPFTGVIFLPPVGLLPGPWRVPSLDGREIQLLSPIPIYGDEMDFKLKNGLDAMLDAFDRHGVTSILSPQRKSVALST